MEIVNFLALLWGFILVIIPLSFLVNSKNTTTIFHIIEDEKMLLFVGMISTVLGIVSIVTYNIFDKSWQILITLLGWIILIKGVVLLFAPKIIVNVYRRFGEDNILIPIKLLLTIVIGCFLLFMGFTA